MDMKLLSYEIWSNTLGQYLYAFAVGAGILVFLNFFKKIIIKKLRGYSQRTTTTVDDFLVSIFGKIFVPLGYFLAVYGAIRTLVFPEIIKNICDIAGIAVITFLSARLITLFLEYLFRLYWIKRGKDDILERSLNGILRVIKVIVWGLAIALFLDNIGFKVSTVIAGLGIGGIAVGLAAQAILKDLFSYFSIIFDRPFEVGDFIIVGDYLGTVEYIGAKTTRIRSLGGEQLIFSNTDLTDSRVRNYKRMERRRVVFKLGVIYQTTAQQLQEVTQIIEKAVKNVPDTVFDRCHFFSYGDFSLNFETVYYVLGSDYNKYMDIQQKINLKIKEEFEKHSIEFAYPTHTVYLNQEQRRETE